MKGTAVLKLALGSSSFTVSRLKELHFGCADFQLSHQDLNLTDNCGVICFSRQESLKIEGAVTESGTAQTETQHTWSSIVYSPYKINIKTEDQFFRSGLPFTGTLELYDVYERQDNESIELCYIFSVKRPWNIKEIRPCVNLTVGVNNSVAFAIPPLRQSVIHFELWVKDYKLK